MTITTEPTPISYDGNGATVTFPVTFKYFQKADVKVTLRDADDEETLWVLNTDYTLTAAGSTGTLTATTAPASGETLIIEIDPDNTQTTKLPLGGNFPTVDVEQALDRAAQRDAKNESLWNRSLRVPTSDEIKGADLEMPIDSVRASKILGFDSLGRPTALSPLSLGIDLNPSLLTLTVSDLSTFGSGDAVQIFTATTAQVIKVRKGTSGSPDTTHGALIKVERTTNIAKPGSADLGEEMAAIMGVTTGTTANEAQTVGVYGGAKSNYGVSASGKGDACGLYGEGIASNYGVGIGAYVQGRRTSTNGFLTGIEVQSANYAGSAGSYSSTGFPTCVGAWVNANGDADSGAGLVIGNPFGYQFKVGIGFNAQVVGGKTGGVADSSIRDDSTSSISLDIRGTHSTAAIRVLPGSGNVIVGSGASVDTIGAFAPNIQLNSTVGFYSAGRYSADAFGPGVDFLKSRNATPGSHTITQSGDALGTIRFGGSNGTTFDEAVRIQATVGATPGASSDMPGTLTIFTTPDGSAAPVARQRIYYDGSIFLNASGSALATNATGGFTHLPSCAGTPTGVPSITLTGAAPVVIDSTNNKLYFYSGGSWRDAGP